jgi:hypothetical protein
MSRDFIDGLHDDLVEAMDRYERRSPRGRRTTGRSPRLLTAATVARVVAAAALVITVVTVARTLAPQPQLQPVRPRVVATLEIGGQPVDASLADGSLWVSDFDGAVIQVDPGERRVVRRVDVSGDGLRVGAGAGSVWALSDGPGCDQSHLVRIDPGDGRIVWRAPITLPDGPTGKPAVGGGGVWVTQGGCHHPITVARHSYAGEQTASVGVGRVAALAAGAGTLWALNLEGTLIQLDARSGRIVHRWPGVAVFTERTRPAMNALVVDGAGVWVLSPDRGAILHVDGGRVVKRIGVDASARHVLAKADDGLWIATSDPLGGHNRLTRIDPRSGRVTGTVDLGIQRPTALIPNDDQLCVVTGNGKILFVRS